MPAQQRRTSATASEALPRLKRVPRRVLILGSTGSVGEQALDVIAGSPDLEPAGLAAESNWERLVAQARAGGVKTVALSDVEAADRARAELDGVHVLAGEDGVRELVAATEPDLVLNGIVGTAGLGPTIARTPRSSRRPQCLCTSMRRT